MSPTNLISLSVLCWAAASSAFVCLCINLKAVAGFVATLASLPKEVLMNAFDAACLWTARGTVMLMVFCPTEHLSDSVELSGVANSQL